MAFLAHVWCFLRVEKHLIILHRTRGKQGFLRFSLVLDAFWGSRCVFLLPVGGKPLWKRRKMSTESGAFQNFSTIPHFCQSTRITAPVVVKQRELCGKTVQKQNFSNKFSTAVGNHVENSKSCVGNLKFPFWFRWALPRMRDPRAPWLRWVGERK